MNQFRRKNPRAGCELRPGVSTRTQVGGPRFGGIPDFYPRSQGAEAPSTIRRRRGDLSSQHSVTTMKSATNPMVLTARAQFGSLAVVKCNKCLPAPALKRFSTIAFHLAALAVYFTIGRPLHKSMASHFGSVVIVSFSLAFIALYTPAVKRNASSSSFWVSLLPWGDTPPAMTSRRGATRPARCPGGRPGPPPGRPYRRRSGRGSGTGGWGDS